MRIARVLGKTAALVSSLTLLAGFVAFRAGAFDRPMSTSHLMMELTSVDSTSLDVLREPHHQSHNWLGQPTELSELRLLDVPDAAGELDPVFRVAAPVLPGSDGIDLWDQPATSNGQSVPLMVVRPSQSPEPAVGYRTSNSLQKTVMPGSKGMSGIFVPAKPFYNSTTPAGGSTGNRIGVTSIPPSSTPMMEVMSGSKSLSAVPIQDWTQVRAIFGNPSPQERLPVMNGSKSGSIDLWIDFRPGVPNESMLNFLPSAQWIFDASYFTSENDPSAEQRTVTNTVMPGSKSGIGIIVIESEIHK